MCTQGYLVVQPRGHAKFLFQVILEPRERCDLRLNLGAEQMCNWPMRNTVKFRQQIEFIAQLRQCWKLLFSWVQWFPSRIRTGATSGVLMCLRNLGCWDLRTLFLSSVLLVVTDQRKPDGAGLQVFSRIFVNCALEFPRYTDISRGAWKESGQRQCLQHPWKQCTQGLFVRQLPNAWPVN